MDMTATKARADAFMRATLYEFVQDPLWYTKFSRFNQVRLLGATAAGSALGSGSVRYAAQASRERLYGLLAELLERDEVALGNPGQGLYEWDSEREPIDMAVVHHSNRVKGIQLPMLSAMELIRLYVPAYQNPAPDDAPRVKGKPIYSGHTQGGIQRFYPYHWIIRQDGTSERLLEDNQIGWHCGDWSVNKRSIALCFDDDLSQKAPNPAMLTEARRILSEEYASFGFDTDTVHPHSDFTKTECPGALFKQWKTDIIPR